MCRPLRVPYRWKYVHIEVVWRLTPCVSLWEFLLEENFNLTLPFGDLRYLSNSRELSSLWVNISHALSISRELYVCMCVCVCMYVCMYVDLNYRLLPFQCLISKTILLEGHVEHAQCISSFSAFSLCQKNKCMLCIPVQSKQKVIFNIILQSVFNTAEVP
jgi:hypothetical protein